jgi:hypothetical protein
MDESSGVARWAGGAFDPSGGLPIAAGAGGVKGFPKATAGEPAALAPGELAPLVVAGADGKRSGSIAAGEPSMTWRIEASP